MKALGRRSSEIETQSYVTMLSVTFIKEGFCE